MRSGHDIKRKRKLFEQGIAAVREDIAADRLESALRHMEKMRKKNLFPEGNDYNYHLIMGQILYWLSDLEEALPHFRASWELPSENKSERLAMFSDYLLYLHYAAHVSNAQVKEAHEAYAVLLGEVPQFTHQKKKRDKLHIGYLTPNFTDHIVLNFSIQLFAGYDRSRFKVTIYDIGGERSEVTAWAAGLTDAYRDLAGASALDAAKQIYADDVDILFDLAGHSAGGRTLQIAAFKPAPVQICGIGYFDTTGLSAVDYFLGDPICDPPDIDTLFVERILRLPHTHLCFTPSERFRSYEHLKRTAHTPVVFGSFNNFAKITDEMLSLWGQILQRVPGARLILKNVHPKQEALARMHKRAERAGIDPARLELRPGAKDYLKDYMDVDVILDTYPYQGGGTTCEALFMGLPVVTLCGTRHGARFGASLLHNVGIGELVAHTQEEYVERAVLLAMDPELLSALHAALQGMMKSSPLMDGTGYIRSMEEAYQMIWERYSDEKE